jgi:ribosomal protein S18 acetylase RimI-like enzyme
MIGREVRDLGDAVMLYDPSDREPFWNRIAGFDWPEATGAFDRRLAEALALFGGLDRIPHFWPSPGFDTPPDLATRLLANGLEDVGAGMLMILDPDRVGAAVPIPDGGGEQVTLERIHRAVGSDAIDAAEAIAAVVADSFAIEPDRVGAIVEETLVLLGRDEFHASLIRIDGEPAAIARRTTFAGASYLSSIGTRPRFRGLGLGKFVSDVALRDALAAGSHWTYLGVFAENDVARRMYEQLGFVPLGEPGPDLILR